MDIFERPSIDELLNSGKDTPMNENMFQNVSIEDLEKELKRRKDEIKASAARKRQEQCANWLKNIDHLLALMPEHSRTSCSDEDPNNHFRNRCTRCMLLSFQREQWWDNDYVLEIKLYNTPISD
jgi:hypothetical protein